MSWDVLLYTKQEKGINMHLFFFMCEISIWCCLGDKSSNLSQVEMKENEKQKI